MRIAAVGRALPSHHYDQKTLLRYLQGVWSDHPSAVRRLETLHENVKVEGRHLALPLERYDELRTFGQTNDAWIEEGLKLAEGAVRDALGRAGLEPGDVDAIFFSSVTGISTPSLDARLVNRMGLRSDIKRIPMFGLGCVGGAAAVSRAADYVRGFPEHVVVVLMVELCSLTLQRSDRSAANLVAASLFGDGAAAAVVVGAERDEGDGPEIRATKSVFYEETEDMMGWRISEEGFRIVLSTEVPAVAQESLAGDVAGFLAEHGLTRADVSSWVCHPGGPKVLIALQEGLSLDRDDLGMSWRHLEQMGNLSSVSVLLILEDTIRDCRPPPGSHGIMLAMGPAFCSELLLLRW